MNEIQSKIAEQIGMLVVRSIEQHIQIQRMGDELARLRAESAKAARAAKAAERRAASADRRATAAAKQKSQPAAAAREG